MVLSFLLIFSLVIQQIQVINAEATVSELVWDGSIASSYQEGSGTKQGPFKISNGAQLAHMAQEVNNGNEMDAYYVLRQWFKSVDTPIVHCDL